jgi:hypothetical protein
MSTPCTILTVQQLTYSGRIDFTTGTAAIPLITPTTAGTHRQVSRVSLFQGLAARRHDTHRRPDKTARRRCRRALLGTMVGFSVFFSGVSRVMFSLHARQIAA